MSAGRKDHESNIRWAVEALEMALKVKYDADAVVAKRRYKLERALSDAFSPAPEREKEEP
jgi:hypothetical protein